MTSRYGTRTERVQVMPDELQDGVGIHVGVEMIIPGETMAILVQAPDEIHLPAELWARFVEEATAIVANGARALGGWPL